MPIGYPSAPRRAFVRRQTVRDVVAKMSTRLAELRDAFGPVDPSWSPIRTAIEDGVCDKIQLVQLTWETFYQEYSHPYQLSRIATDAVKASVVAVRRRTNELQRYRREDRPLGYDIQTAGLDAAVSQP